MFPDSLTALIIDDAMTVRQSLRTILGQLGITRVDTASSIGEARRRIGNGCADIILCDYHYGSGTTGQEFLEELRQNGGLPLSTVFFMITAEASYEKVVSVAEIAPDDYLLKPFTSGQLGERLLRAWRKKKFLNPIYREIEANRLEQAVYVAQARLDEGGPFRTDVARLLAGILVEMGRSHEAMAIYEKLLQDKVIPWAKLGLAKVYSATGRQAEAEKIMQTIVEANDMYVDAYDQLAAHYIQEGREKEAMEVMEKALKVTPHNLDRLQKAGQMAYRLGDNEKARQFLEKAVAHGGNSSLLDIRSVMYLAIASYAEGKHREGDKMLHLMQGLVERQSGYDKQVLHDLTKAAKCWATQKPDEAILTLSHIAEAVHDKRIDFELATDFISVCARMTAGEGVVKDWISRFAKRFATSRVAVEKLEFAATHSKELHDIIHFINQEINQIANQGMTLVVANRVREAADHLVENALATHNNRLLLAAANASIRYAKELAEDAISYWHKASQASSLLQAQNYDSATLEALQQELQILQHRIKAAKV